MRWLPLLLLPLLGCRAEVDSGGLLRSVDPARSEVFHQGVLMARTNAAADWHGAVVIDGEGTERWRWRGLGEVVRIRRNQDGTLLVALDDNRHSVGAVRRESLEGVVFESIPTPLVHHDLLTLPDGRWAWLEHDHRRLRVDGRERKISSDKLMVAAPGGEPEQVFSFLANYPVTPWFVCSHMSEGWRFPGQHQWTHSNSLVLDPARPGEILILPRNLDAIVAVDIDRGRVTEQLGGRDSTVPFPAEAELSHPHMSQVTPTGTLLVFDNGLHHDDASRVVELARTDDGLEVVWSVDHPSGERNGYLGDARRLPGGNTLVAWSSSARLTEYAPSGDIVWDMELEDTKHIGRIQLWEGELP